MTGKSYVVGVMMRVEIPVYATNNNDAVEKVCKIMEDREKFCKTMPRGALFLVSDAKIKRWWWEYVTPENEEGK